MFNFNLHTNPQNVNNKEYYNILNINKLSSQSEIKKAYYKLAKKYHPDKGGDEKKFKKITMAYHTLSDPEKKEIYDKYGEDGLKDNGMNMNPFNIFNMHTQHSNQKKKGKSVIYELSITLNELYNGCIKKLRINRNIMCLKCTGSGLKENCTKKKCSTCNGTGMQVIRRQIGPMLQQIQSICRMCLGKCYIIKDSDKCKRCNGSCIIKNTKIFNIHIEKGMKNGEKIIFHEESDQLPNIIPGDVIIIIKEEKHKYYCREGSDLWIKKSISLFESLTNYEFVIKHLDGRKLKLISPNEVTKPNSVKIIENEGMLEKNNPYNKGKLLVKFTVKFPDIIPEQYHQILMTIFKKKEDNREVDNKVDDKYQLINFDYESYKNKKELLDDDISSDNEYVEVNGCPTQ